MKEEEEMRKAYEGGNSRLFPLTQNILKVKSSNY